MSNIKSHQFKAILDDAIAGKSVLPNIVEIQDPREALFYIYRCMGAGHQPYKFWLAERKATYYPKVFTNVGGMGSSFDGSGAIIWQDKAYKFHMCDHNWDESGANRLRGWHPKRCTKCGFDASIDSGD